jgi:hypothetical protein
MQRLAGVFFHVRARDADGPGRSVVHREGQ